MKLKVQCARPYEVQRGKKIKVGKENAMLTRAKVFEVLGSDMEGLTEKVLDLLRSSLQSIRKAIHVEENFNSLHSDLSLLSD